MDLLLCLDARGGVGWTHAMWVTPGSAVVSASLRHALAGVVPARWFSQIDPRTAGFPGKILHLHVARRRARGTP
jgi:hypothetical protein